MKTGYSIGDVMTKQPIAVSKDTTIKDCASIMNENHVGALIIKEDEKVLGVLTEQDIVRQIVAHALDAKEEIVSSHMAKNLFTITPDKDIFEALVVMRDENIRHLPVVNKDNIIGLVTLKDILKIQPTLFDILVEKFELREEEDKPVNI